MNKTLIGALACAAAVTLAACETTGTGTGSGNVRGTSKPVAFTWESSDSTSGTITATFGSGRVFRGNYYQITHDTRVERLDPLWEGWGRPYRRNTWRYWDRESEVQFVKTYSGRVLANLHDESDAHMRCRFTLISPSRGMAGGGEGRCELSDSKREINAEFPRQG
jgi:hypothetical protein